MENLSALLRELKQECPHLTLREGEPLARLTSFHIGGPAALVAQPESEEELRAVLLAAARFGIRPVILGAGTNVLAPDEGLDTLVIRLRDGLTKLKSLPNGHIVAESGVTLRRLALFALDCSLTGLEFAHGIPGTVGGGVVMNAGAYGGELRQVTVKTTLMCPDGTLEEYEGDRQGFSYRKSAFSDTDGVIVRAEFALTPGDPAQIQDTMQTLMKKRQASQPLNLPSAGSTFKRPATGYAAALIDQAGLKGFQIGGAAVSEKHAGFVVNLGGATCAEVQALMAEVQSRVLKNSGVTLEPEVRLLHL